MKIIPSDIKLGELVDVLVDDNSEYLAKVLSNEGDYLLVTYLSSSEKVYKSAKVFSFEAKAERVDFDTLTTHYSDIIDVKDIGLVKIAKNMFVYTDDIDEDSSSEIETDESDSDDSAGSLDDFIVPDDEEVLIKPNDHLEVDTAWSKWRPTSAGAQRFKKNIDSIEEHMNHQIDEKYVFKN